MPNIVKNTSSLLADSPDNNQGLISAQVLRNVIYSSYNKLDLPNLSSLTIDSSGNISLNGSFSAGNGAFVVNTGSGNTTIERLIVTNTTSLDNGTITTNGSGRINAVSFSGSGVNLTSVPAASLTGTINDARLSANVAIKANTGQLVATSFANANNTFSTGGSGDVHTHSLNIDTTLSVGGLTAFDGGAAQTDGNGGFLGTAVIVGGETMGYVSIKSDSSAEVIRLDAETGLQASNTAFFNGGITVSGTTTLDNGEISTNGQGSISYSGNVSASSINSGTTITSGTSGSSNGLIRVANADGGYPITLDGGSGNIKVKNGSTEVIILDSSGGIYAAGSVNVVDRTTLDNGAITTDGGGNVNAGSLTVAGGLYSGGAVSFDNGSVTTDGNGALTIGSSSTHVGRLRINGNLNEDFGGDFAITKSDGTTGFYVNGGNNSAVSMDSGLITTDGSGTLTVKTLLVGGTSNGGSTTLDGGAISTNGAGKINASGFSAGSGGIFSGGSIEVQGNSSLDGGAITTDGAGGLTANQLYANQGAFVSQGFVVSSGTTSLDSGAITTDGVGSLQVNGNINCGETVYATNFSCSSLAFGIEVAGNIAPNNSLFIDADNDSLVFKDSGGNLYTVNLTPYSP